MNEQLKKNIERQIKHIEEHCESWDYFSSYDDFNIIKDDYDLLCQMINKKPKELKP